MQIIIYDTEFTAWEGSAQRAWSQAWEFKEIIQFSAQKIKITPSEVFPLETFSTYVRPIKNTTLSGYIKELTGIDQQNVNNGFHPKDLFKAINKITNEGQIPMFSWGNDFHALYETAQISNINIKWLNSYNLIPAFKEFNINTEVTSGNLYREFNLDLTIHQHNAMDDTLSLVESLKELHKKDSLKLIKSLASILK